MRMFELSRTAVAEGNAARSWRFGQRHPASWETGIAFSGLTRYYFACKEDESNPEHGHPAWSRHVLTYEDGSFAGVCMSSKWLEEGGFTLTR